MPPKRVRAEDVETPQMEINPRRAERQARVAAADQHVERKRKLPVQLPKTGAADDLREYVAKDKRFVLEPIQETQVGRRRVMRYGVKYRDTAGNAQVVTDTSLYRLLGEVKRVAHTLGGKNKRGRHPNTPLQPQFAEGGEPQKKQKTFGTVPYQLPFAPEVVRNEEVEGSAHNIIGADTMLTDPSAAFQSPANAGAPSTDATEPVVTGFDQPELLLAEEAPEPVIDSPAAVAAAASGSSGGSGGGGRGIVPESIDPVIDRLDRLIKLMSPPPPKRKPKPAVHFQVESAGTEPPNACPPDAKPCKPPTKNFDPSRISGLFS